MNFKKIVQLGNRHQTLYLLPLICFIVFFIIESMHRPIEDYGGYYFGSKFFLDGSFNASTIYETYAFNHKIYAEGYTNLLLCYTPFPPTTSLFFLPFTFFELYASKLIFNCLSSLLFIFSLVRIVKYLNIPNWVYLLLPLIFFIPIRNNIFFGQAYFILFSLLVEGYIFYKKESFWSASLVWGLAIVLKIFPVICLLFLVFEKKWKQLFCIATAVFSLLIISFYFNGIEVWKTYLLEIFPRVSNGELNDAFTPQFQSMFMLLKNCFVADSLLNPHPVMHSPVFFNIFNFLFKVTVVSFCAFVSLNKKLNGIVSKNAGIVKFGLWTIASILLSPNGSTYSLIMLLIPFLSIVQIEKNILWKGMLLVVLFSINNLPVGMFFSLPAVFQFPRLYLMIGLFLLLIYIYGVTVNYKILLLFSALFGIQLISALYRNDKDNSTYYFSQKKHTLIYDYKILNNKLIVFYDYDTAGEKSDTLNFEQQIKQTDSLYLKNQQIYFGKQQLTYSNDRKMKPILLNTGQVLYLSDKNRGIGFYTLRTKKIF
jgi:hypothetical protein